MEARYEETRGFIEQIFPLFSFRCSILGSLGLLNFSSSTGSFDIIRTRINFQLAM
ncbi:hypothetical protein ABI_02470 [Asticcacaulis biprosthecium C19]|uniref:Uncharacterized protein n=1 Tax=Asticcacaulis biprosthecium C19 TaxID=715226 RepID=F4QIQ6_9CAUL|nr:hypothetical protein ABI_02470 [Asticcacaulis biprosthecium C19]